MKKFIAVFAVLLFVAPAFAADWAFYGSQRVAHLVCRPGLRRCHASTARTTTQATQWAFQGNSRLGAKVKADKVTGQIELALGPAATAATAPSPPGAPTARGSSRTTPS